MYVHSKHLTRRMYLKQIVICVDKFDFPKYSEHLLRNCKVIDTAVRLKYNKKAGKFFHLLPVAWLKETKTV